jgi:protein-S-isoprenylcysteine O-methyltransferase Ste14
MLSGAAILYAAWGLYLLAFVVSHLRVRAARGQRAPETPVRRARVSELGMTLQFLGVLLTFALQRSPAGSTGIVLISCLVAAMSVWLTWLSLAHIGRQWRLKAVVMSDHELITSGPYRWLRHPVYTAFFGMMVANILMFTNWSAGIAALVLYVIGTEVRIRAEERILRAQFPAEFAAYESRTPAWIPPLH